MVKKLSRLFESGQSGHDWEKQVCNYLNVKSQKEIKLIYKVSQNLLLGKYHEMVAENPVTTAKVLAIQTHIRILKTRIN